MKGPLYVVNNPSVKPSMSINEGFSTIEGFQCIYNEELQEPQQIGFLCFALGHLLHLILMSCQHMTHFTQLLFIGLDTRRHFLQLSNPFLMPRGKYIT